jgi:hypothetical protein
MLTGLLLVALVGAWALSAVGGLVSVWVWGLGIQLIVPVLGLGVLLGVAVHAIRRRTWSLAHGVAILVALIAIWPLLWGFGFFPVRYPSSLDEMKPSVTVRLPLDGEVVVLWGGDRLETNYHATWPDQRWAYDLAVEPVLTQSDELQDYGCFDRPVMAPAAGTIVSTRNDLPDHTPGKLSGDFDHALGNHVVIKLDETGTYLFLAHFRKGSVEVARGAHVEPGDRLARCGNSGNTSEPHVHVHHQRQSPDESTPGFAEGLPLYFTGPDGKRMPVGGIETKEGKPYYNGAVVTDESLD